MLHRHCRDTIGCKIVHIRLEIFGGCSVLIDLVIDLVEHEDEPGVIFHRGLCPGFPLSRSSCGVYLLDLERVFISSFGIVSLIDAPCADIPGIPCYLDDSRAIVPIRVDEDIRGCEACREHGLSGSRYLAQSLCGGELRQEWMRLAVSAYFVSRPIDLLYLSEIHIILRYVEVVVIRCEDTRAREPMVDGDRLGIDGRSKGKRCYFPGVGCRNRTEIKSLYRAIVQGVYYRHFGWYIGCVLVGEIIGLTIYYRRGIWLPSGVPSCI